MKPVTHPRKVVFGSSQICRMVLNCVALLWTSLTGVQAADNNLPRWNLEALSQPPAVVAAAEGKVEGVQSLYVAALPYKGRPTKFYAYLGFPKDVTGKVPAVVLVHGGGGSAFVDWVKYWNAKGYAALAMDTEGQVPVKTTDANPRWQTIDGLNLPWAGGPQRTAMPFGDYDQALEEQWMYHAVADALLSVSLLAAHPDVDPNRIGIVGISWGSAICSIAGGIDPRLTFVVPQYIGGNLQLGNAWYDHMKNHPATYGWNPSNFYTRYKGKAHWLWINGINDRYGLPPMITASWRETGTNSWMSLLPTQGHGHIWIEDGPNALREIYAFADSVTRGTKPLARITRTTPGNGQVSLTWVADPPIARAELCCTTDTIPLIEISGESRKDWEKVRYKVDRIELPAVTTASDGSRQATFPLPADMKAGVVNLIDTRGLSVSCEFLDFSK